MSSIENNINNKKDSNLLIIKKNNSNIKNVIDTHKEDNESISSLQGVADLLKAAYVNASRTHDYETFLKLIPFIKLKGTQYKFHSNYTIEAQEATFTNIAWKPIPIKFKIENVKFEAAKFTHTNVEVLADKTVSIALIKDTKFGDSLFCPITVKDAFGVENCIVQNFKGILKPNLKLKVVSISKSSIASLDGFPISVERDLIFTKSVLESLKFLPSVIGTLKIKDTQVKSGWLHPYTSKIKKYDVNGFLGDLYSTYDNIYDAASFLIENGREKEAEL